MHTSSKQQGHSPAEEDVVLDYEGGLDGVAESLIDAPWREQQPYVEEVEDEHNVWMRYIQSYPGQVAKTLGEAENMFHTIRAEQEALGLDPWAPFANEEEWHLVKWLIARVGQTAIDEFLKLPIVSSQFRNNN